jgi:sterol desaturase/sphingolipid hydroxylase (fatty acid hydroxylase superfamily)
MRALLLPVWITAPAAIVCFLALAWMERRRPLRASVEPKLRRAARNLTVAALGAGAIVIAETPFVLPLVRMIERRQWGLLGILGLPLWLEIPAGLLLMDYTFYVWHVLMHRVPLLWRFHMVHHVDLDLDASTALRFHFGELIASVPWRAAQVAMIGLTPLVFSVWQFTFLLAIMFHHSNIEIPIAWERRLNRILVTPRMHGIHHSIVREETNSNWSSGLTVWDWLHSTLRLNIPQREIAIGVPAFRDPKLLTLRRILPMPFERQPYAWILPGNGEPALHPAIATRDHLLP